MTSAEFSDSSYELGALRCSSLGATDEQIAEYMNARAYELGIVSSNEQGQGRARTYSRDLQRHWHEMLKSVFIKGNIVNQALREIKAP